MTEKKLYCELCGRELEEPFDRHHIVPRSMGGNKVVSLHRICHSKIHSVLTDRELKDKFNTIEKLLKHPEINKFINWVVTKPPGFYKRTKKSNFI